MKNKLPLVFAFLCILHTSCKDFLEEEVYTFLSPNNFYTSAEEAILAVNSAYDALQQRSIYQVNMYKLGDFPSDVADRNGSLHPFHNFTATSENVDLYNFWSITYEAINRSNAVIGRIPPIDMAEDLKNRLIGEAKFLRALHYFNLIRIFGNIPLVAEETTGTKNIYPTNVGTSDAVWELIIDDLKYAETHLKDSYSPEDVGRATTGAAKGLLAKVYLTRSGWGVADEWGLAVQKCEEVMGMGYELFDDYTKVFDLFEKNGKEHIFQIQFNVINAQGMARLEKDWGVRGLPKSNPYQGDSHATGTRSFYNTWDKSDKRFYATWLDSLDNNGTPVYYPGGGMDNPHTRKYKIQAENVPRLQRFSQNVSVLRYADVLLMHSEAENMANGPSAKAVQGINQVRARAGLSPIDYTAVTNEQLRQLIITERAKELCFEFHTFFDYQRQGVLREKMAAIGIIVEEYRRFFPIPQIEIDLNPNLKQNNGY